MDQDLHKELDLIQGVISRMANNSFLIKGWAMTLMSALIAFGKDSILASTHGVFYLVAMAGILVPFWWLDAFYLRQERLFRKIYQRAVQDPSANSRTRFDMNPNDLLGAVQSVWKIMLTDFMKWFYLSFLSLILLAILAIFTGFFS
ncbi:MAG: hypothetical protein ACOYOO_13985 [Saprospiraceae bacterium]|jgi:hypothetical protein